jgi:hypothetical protein
MDGVCFTQKEARDWRNARDEARRVFTSPKKPLLLFFGMKDETDGSDPLNPSGLKRAGFGSARSLNVDGEYIRVPSQYNMPKAQNSPFSFNGKAIQDTITNESWRVTETKLNLSGLDLKAVIPGKVSGAMVFRGCENFDIGKPCEFCRVGATIGKAPISPNILVSELKAIRERGVEVYSVSLNTGQMPNGGEFDAILSCAQAIRAWDARVAVSAELWPASIPMNLELAAKSISAFQVNMELANDEARASLCPAKPKSEEYFKAFERLRGWGFGVSSVLQTNFYLEKEPIGDVLRAIGRMLSIGVVPELLVSRAVGSAIIKDGFFNRETNFSENIGRFLEYLGRARKISAEFGTQILSESASFSSGCVRCGLCNINSVLRRSAVPP